MLRYLTAGESHGPALTAILEGLPAGIPLTAEIINADLARRQDSLGAGGRMAIEKDTAQILGGVMEGKTSGAPLAVLIENADHANWKGKAVPPYTIPRPGHADLAAVTKYGYDDIRPSLERASARETASRVAIGAACRAFLKLFDITVTARIVELGGTKDNFEDTVAKAKAAGETLGGIIEAAAIGLPVGLGSHVHWERRLDARLAQALISIPAMKGLEIGDAFAMTETPGSQAQDSITSKSTRPTNHCGGLEGGMTNGQPLVVRVAMKPIPTTITPQTSIDLATGESAQTQYERSDTCPVPRAVVIVEAAIAYVLTEALIEKLGGDSIDEMLPRYKALPQPESLRLNARPHIFWN